ncbi:hypothetical protein [Streptomyces sp. NBC_00568]|uniref:hypothetical protein n=1 Tax=Streptomyces sp. NBC_00568 TaxID=2975779 RepID=UPI00225222FE|nr:hypothetical protein [Streptomyces sp. NBC_00568]MCX4993481.1 hypothetical protein [Streptomyces sp. NBC_00568]
MVGLGCSWPSAISPRADDRVPVIAAELAAAEAGNRTVTADQVAHRYDVSRRTGERLLAAARQHLQQRS